MLTQGMEPPHPGEILKDLFLEPLGLTQVEAAKNLGVSRKTLSMLLNGRQGISAEMALRLSKALKTSVEVWLNLQVGYDLWHAERKTDLSKVKVFRGIRQTRAKKAIEKANRLSANA